MTESDAPNIVKAFHEDTSDLFLVDVRKIYGSHEGSANLLGALGNRRTTISARAQTGRGRVAGEAWRRGNGVRSRYWSSAQDGSARPTGTPLLRSTIVGHPDCVGRGHNAVVAQCRCDMGPADPIPARLGDSRSQTADHAGCGLGGARWPCDDLGGDLIERSGRRLVAGRRRPVVCRIGRGSGVFGIVHEVRVSIWCGG